jgi:hypothetical protein
MGTLLTSVGSITAIQLLSPLWLKCSPLLLSEYCAHYSDWHLVMEQRALTGPQGIGSTQSLVDPTLLPFFSALAVNAIGASSQKMTYSMQRERRISIGRQPKQAYCSDP